MTLLYDVLKFGKEELRIGRIILSPASIGTGMASRTVRMHLHEQCILVAIVLYAYKI